MSETYTVSKEDAVNICVQVGYVKAGGYSDTRLHQRLSSLDESISADDLGTIKDAKARKQIKILLRAIEKGATIEITDEKITKAKKPVEKKDEAPAPKRGPGRPVNPDGVIGTIAALLRKASEKRPISKPQILEALTRKFPDRNAKSMQTTIEHQCPSVLKRKGNDIRKNSSGYWIQ